MHSKTDRMPNWQFAIVGKLLLLDRDPGVCKTNAIRYTDTVAGQIKLVPKYNPLYRWVVVAAL